MENEQPNYYDEYEIDLREYIMLLWDNKFFIGGLVILAIIAAFLFSTLVISPQYESEAIILAPDFRMLSGNEISKEEYISFLTGDLVLKNMLEMVNQGRKEEEKITGQSLLNRLSYNLNKDTNQIEFSFQFNDPEKTSTLLNEWINKFITRVENYISEKNNSYYENIKIKATNDYQDYQSALKELKSFESNNNLNLLRKNLSSKGNNLINLNSDIIDISNKIDATEKELEYIHSRLEKTEQYLIRKNIISDEFLQKIRAVNSQQELINLLSTEEEFLNPEYQNLINREISLSTSITSRKNNLENYLSDKENLIKELDELQKRISSLSEEKTLIEDNLSNIKSTYQNSNNKLNALEQSSVELVYDISVLSSAKTPESSVSPNTRLNIAIAAVLALMLAVFIVFFKEFMKEDK